MLCYVCVDVGVLKDAVLSKPDVNSTLVILNLRSNACLRSQSNFDCLIWVVSLFLCDLQKEKNNPVCLADVLLFTGIIFCPFTSITVREKKNNRTSKIKLRIY